MSTRPPKTVAIGLVLAAVSACDLPPMISDTGYRGTWARGNERNVSIVAITEVGGRWYFRWTKRSADGRREVFCDWNGRCVERSNGKPIATYAITTRYDADRGILTTDTVEERVGSVTKRFEYTDVMEVGDHGLTLWNSTTDRDGQHFDGDARPRRSFTKVANSVADPPRPGRP